MNIKRLVIASVLIINVLAASCLPIESEFILGDNVTVGNNLFVTNRAYGGHDPIADNEYTTKNYVDSVAGGGGGAGNVTTAGGIAARIPYYTAATNIEETTVVYNAASGNVTMQNNLTVNGRLYLGHDPVADNEAVTKNYADSIAGGGGGNVTTAGGIAGLISYFTAANNIEEAVNLFWNNVNGWLGIGGAPASPLDVFGDIHSNSDINADNDLSAGNDLHVTDDVDIGGDITITGTVDGYDVSTLGAASHTRSHAITSTSDHTSTATPNTILMGDANGLPVNSMISQDAGATKATVGGILKATSENITTTLSVGGVITAASGITAAGKKITDVATPTNPHDAATKAYADSVGGVGGSGTINTIPKFSAATTLTNSNLSDSGTTITSSADIAMATGKNLQLFKNLTNDVTFSGVTFIGTAGEALTEGATVYLKNDGKYYKTDADAVATMPCVAMSSAQIAINTTGVFLTQGFMRFDSWTWVDEGVELYVSGTAGAMTATAPTGANTIIQKVATVVAIAASGAKDIVYFNPSMTPLMDTPANSVVNAAPTSNWAYDHEIDTTTHGTTGNVVGTSDNQTLSNKTISSPHITGTANFAGGANVAGNIGVTGTVDGVDLSSNYLVPEIYRRMRYTQFPLYNMSGTDTGSGFSSGETYLVVQSTGTTVTSSTSKYAHTKLLWPHNSSLLRLDWDYDFIYLFTIKRGGASDANVISRVQIREDSALNTGALDDYGIGIEIDNYTMYAESRGSGGVTKKTAFGVSSPDLIPTEVVIDYTAGSSIKWYINGILRYTESTATDIPSGDAVDQTFLMISINNNQAGNNCVFEVGACLIGVEK